MTPRQEGRRVEAMFQKVRTPVTWQTLEPQWPAQNRGPGPERDFATHCHCWKHCSRQRKEEKYMASVFLVPPDLPPMPPTSQAQLAHQPERHSLQESASCSTKQIGGRARNRSESKANQNCQIPQRSSSTSAPRDMDENALAALLVKTGNNQSVHEQENC